MTEMISTFGPLAVGATITVLLVAMIGGVYLLKFPEWRQRKGERGREAREEMLRILH